MGGALSWDPTRPGGSLVDDGRSGTPAQSLSSVSGDGTANIKISADYVLTAKGYAPAPAYIAALQSAGATLAAATYAAIMSAVNAASAAGGGTVCLGPTTYYIGSYTLPLVENVVYEGTGWISGFQNIGGGWAAEGGTLIKGDGTAHGFSGKITAVSGTFDNVMIRGTGVKNLMISTVKSGIRAGAKNSGGLAYSTIQGVKIIKASEWGLMLFNTEVCNIKTVKIFGCANGYYHGNDANWNGGDSMVEDVWVEPSTGSGTLGTKKSRMIWLNALSGALNSMSLAGSGANGLFISGIKSISGTATSGSADIGVTDTSAIEVGMPVILTTAVTGFVANKTYFVKSYVENTSVQICNCDYTDVLTNVNSDTAISPTASGAVVIGTMGFPGIQASSTVEGSRSVTLLSLYNCNTENAGTGRYLFQGVDYLRVTGGAPNNTVFKSPYIYAAVLRNVYECVLEFNHSGIVDSDSIWSGDYTSADGFPSTATYIGNYQSGFGIRKYAGAGAALWLSANDPLPSLRTDASSAILYYNRPTAHPHFAAGSGATINSTWGNIITFTAAAGGTITLPVAAPGYLGVPYYINNPQANAVTVSTQSSQNIIGLGVSGTSITIAPNSSALLVCQYTGSTYYWARYA